jgi:hypothetical protein
VNKHIIREAISGGFSIHYYSIIYKTSKIDLNKFLFEINKLRFTRSIKESINIYKESFLSQNNYNPN